MAPFPGYTKNQTVSNGTVYYYTGDAAAQAISASMVRAELARTQQQQQLTAALARLGENPGPDVVGAIIGGVVALATAGATIAGTAGTMALASSSAASLAAQSIGSLEVEIENRSDSPVVLASASTSGCSSVSLPSGIAVGESDKAVVVQNDGFDSNATLTLAFTTGGGLTNENTTLLNFTKVVCSLEYTSDSVWNPTIQINDSTLPSGKDNKTIAVAFVGDDSTLDCTVAGVGTERANSELYFLFLPSSQTFGSES